MNVAERRGEIKKILLANETAISAAKLAEKLKVSRQIIVGDIALMRAEGMEIKSTPRDISSLIRRMSIHISEPLLVNIT